MKCEYCEKDVPAGSRVCPSCGAAVRIEQMPAVAPIAQPSQPIQQQIARGQVIGSQSPNPPKSRVAYILLGLFLGGLGIHNFYAGRPNRALGQLLTTLLAGWLILPLFAVFIWCIVDICAITTDGDGVRFA